MQGRPAPRLRFQRQAQGGVERCLWRGAQGFRSGIAEGLGYRQRPRAGQGKGRCAQVASCGSAPLMRPARQALPDAARHFARVVAHRQTHGLAVSRPEPGHPLTIRMSFNLYTGPENDRVLHLILHYANALLAATASLPLLCFERNCLADDRRMLAAKWARNRKARVFHNFTGSARASRKQAVWRSRGKVHASPVCEQ